MPLARTRRRHEKEVADNMKCAECTLVTDKGKRIPQGAADWLQPMDSNSSLAAEATGSYHGSVPRLAEQQSLVPRSVFVVESILVHSLEKIGCKVMLLAREEFVPSDQQGRVNTT